MPAPYDYSLNLPDPTQHFLQGLQIAQVMEQQKAAREQAEQAKAVFARMRALGSNATADDYVAASLELPQYAEQFQKNWEMIDKGKQNALFQGGARAYMLAGSDPEAAAGVLEDYATGYRNAGDEASAKQFDDAAKVVRMDPEGARTAIGVILGMADGERFKSFAQQSEATTFQKDFQFIKDTFGDDAAAEFAQFGRGGIVSIPLGNGQTYVGPAASAPGATNWRQNAETESAPDILQRAASNKSITEAEAGVIRQSLGPNGQAAFDKWRTENGIRIVRRTGTASDGRRVVEYEDGTVDYAD